MSLVLAAVLAAFTVYMAAWNNDRHSDLSCDRGSSYATEQACTAKNEDRILMLASGGGAIALLVFGLIRRYPPGSRS